MSLADDLAATIGAIDARKSLCALGVKLATLSEKDRAALEAALKHPLVSNSAIGDVLRQNGKGVDKTVLSKHRNGKCRCVGTE